MKGVLPTLLVFLLVIATSPLFSQSASVSIPVIDMRGYSPKKAIWEAVQNTKQNAVVVLIRGGDDILLEKVKAKLQALAHQGYTRIGIIRSKTSPGEVGASFGVVADGSTYAVIKDAKPNTTDLWKLFNLTRDAYSEFVTPKLTTGG